jgi:hypothetical protein
VHLVRSKKVNRPTILEIRFATIKSSLIVERARPISTSVSSRRPGQILPPFQVAPAAVDQMFAHPVDRILHQAPTS